MGDLDKYLSVTEVVEYRRAMGHTCTRSAVQQAIAGGGLPAVCRAGRWFVHVADLVAWLERKAEPIRSAQLGLSRRNPAAGAPDHEAT